MVFFSCACGGYRAAEKIGEQKYTGSIEMSLTFEIVLFEDSMYDFIVHVIF